MKMLDSQQSDKRDLPADSCKISNSTSLTVRSPHEADITDATGNRGEYAVEQWDCPLCGSSEYRLSLVFPRSVHRVVKCSHCGMLRLQPRLAETELSSLYHEGYCGKPENDRPRNESVLARIARWKQIRLVRRTHQWRLQTLERHTSRRRLLEVGCGDGGFLSFLHARGWEVTGIDFSAHAARIARARGIEVFLADFARTELPPNTFPLVVAYHVLEHVYHLDKFMTQVHRILAPNGILVAAVPNAASLGARLFGNRWIGWAVPYHVNLFTPETLTKILQRKAFRVRDVEHWSPGAGAIWKVGAKASVRAVLFRDRGSPGVVARAKPPTGQDASDASIPARTVLIDLLADPAFTCLGFADRLFHMGSTMTIVAEKLPQ